MLVPHRRQEQGAGLALALLVLVHEVKADVHHLHPLQQHLLQEQGPLEREAVEEDEELVGLALLEDGVHVVLVGEALAGEARVEADLHLLLLGVDMDAPLLEGADGEVVG